MVEDGEKIINNGHGTNERRAAIRDRVGELEDCHIVNNGSGCSRRRSEERTPCCGLPHGMPE